jgi:hypothetical protein
VPWEVKKNDNQFCVYKKGEDTPVAGGCHDTREQAVRHMRALYVNVDEDGMRKHSAILLSEGVLQDTEDPNVKWLKAWRYSVWEHPKYGVIDITPEVGAQFKTQFDERVLGREHLVNYDHGMDPAKGGKAAGTILQIDPREDGIYYQVRFTDVALSEISAGEWRYLSPEYKDTFSDPETNEDFANVPVDLALTNVPFFKHMAPLNFAELELDPDESKFFAEWTTAYKNDLPDGAFLYIEAGGSKDSEGKTVPRSLRHFPVRDANGKVDLPHVRNALARIAQSSYGNKAALMTKAKNLLSRTNATKGGSEVDELLKQFAGKLGVTIADDAEEEDVLAAAEELNKTIEPLRKAKEEGARQRTFREAFPEEYKQMKKLQEASIESNALVFAEGYARFTVKDGENSWKSTFGFSQLVIDKIAEVHKKFSTREAGEEDLKELLDLIGDKGIVDYSEQGSARNIEGRIRSDDPKIAFSEAILEIQEKDDLPYEAAITMASQKYPELYEKYLKAIPQR